MFGYHTWCRSHLQCYHLPSDRMSLLWCPNPSFIFKKICNIETYVLTNQCCKVTLVKTMLLTSNLNVLPPTQRRLVFFFHLKYRPLRFLILDSLCGSLSSHLSKGFNQTIFWCPVVLKEEGVAFQSIQCRSRLHYKICFVCVFIYGTVCAATVYYKWMSGCGLEKAWVWSRGIKGALSSVLYSHC